MQAHVVVNEVVTAVVVVAVDVVTGVVDETMTEVGVSDVTVLVSGRDLLNPVNKEKK